MGNLQVTDENTDESNQNFISSLVGIIDRGANDCDNELSDKHGSRTIEQKAASSELVNGPHARDGHSDIHDVRGDGTDGMSN